MNGVMRSVWLAVHALIAVPVVWVWLQTLFARMPRGQNEGAPVQPRPPEHTLAVLIPAHNEGIGLIPTLQSIRPHLAPGDRILVVADNCSDDTAAIASAQGVDVVERTDTTRRGKGWALDFGVKHLQTLVNGRPPAFVMIFDADCQWTSGNLNQLVNACAQSNRPVQSMYLMTVPGIGRMQQRFAEFAWRMKNKVRPLGGLALGLPCQLMGTGMMFSWDAIANAPLASGNIVEDMQMGVDLALRGRPPLYAPFAVVSSQFPASAEGAQSQRARWEHGHLATLLQAGPRLIAGGLKRMSPSLVMMGVDLMVPPLALLLMALGAMTLLDVALFAITGWATAMWVGFALLGLFFMAIALAWWRHGEGTITGQELLLAPLYALRKVPLYLAFVVKRQTEWVRAKRDGE